MRVPETYSAQERAALLVSWLLTAGPLTVAQVADRLYETKAGAWKLLNEIGGVLPLVNDGGWWYVDIKHLSDARALHGMLGRELEDAPPGTLYGRPLKRADIERLYRVLGAVLQLAEVPVGKSAAAILERERAEQGG